jgi:hypothetical protein
MLPRQVSREQTLKKFPVIRDFQVQKFMDNDEFVKMKRLLEQIWIERNAAFRRAGCPFFCHSLNSNLFRPGFNFCGPVTDRRFQGLCSAQSPTSFRFHASAG